MIGRSGIVYERYSSFGMTFSFEVLIKDEIYCIFILSTILASRTDAVA